MRFAYAILIATLLSMAVVAQAPQLPVTDSDGSKVEDVYLARDDGAGNAGEVAESFTTVDLPIHCVVMLAVMEPTAVRMQLVALKVNGVKPESKVVATAYTTKQGEDRVYFAGRPRGNWVAGTYRIDVFVADKKEKSLIFEIKGPSSAPAVATKFASVKSAKKRN